jgi:hypothetical protein
MTYEYCAQVDDGIVVWIIKSDSAEWCNENLSGDWLPVHENNYCGIGWTWDGEQFMPPEIEEVEDEEIN